MGLILLALIVVIGGYWLIFIIEHWPIVLIVSALFITLSVLAALEDKKKRDEGAGSYSPPPAQDDSVDVFEALAAASLLFDDSGTKKHNGRCDGDCANCPPHYGYRYGRYYYGRCHQHSCQFGGNCGGGRYD